MGIKFREKFLEINSSLHRNTLFFEDNFIQGIINAYDLFFQLISSIDYDALAPLPKEYKDVVAVGRVPLHLVVK